MRTVSGDGRWLSVMAALVAVEFGWWLIAWSLRIAPSPYLGTYLLASAAALATALAIHRALGNGSERPSWTSIIAGSALIAAGSSLFLPLKYAIPNEVPFWLDGPLVRIEGFGGTHPWQLLDRLLGWATAPIDRIYGLWLPVQSIAVFSIIVAAPSPAKSRALIAYSLAWFVLGIAGATLFSSAGPIFFDRLYGGQQFAALTETLRLRGASIVLAESDAMWLSLTSGKPTIVAGISAVPSMHVAISLWILLAARAMAPRASGYAFAYFLFIWIASVQLGWHYALDGLAGALGMLAIWALAGVVDRAVMRRGFGFRRSAAPSAAP